MTWRDRLRIKAEAWTDRFWEHGPEFIFACGVLVTVVTILALVV